MNGILLINKPKDYTSHDIVAVIKRLTNEKVGHTGTLDPNATGVLPLLVGKATGLSKYLINHDKIYEGGLLQYVEFLKINGYTLCGDELSKNSKCKTCLKTLDEHTKEQHKFRPLYYSIISGDTPEKERSEIVRIYNSPKNIDGDLISVLMLSSVAASGAFSSIQCCIIE